MWAFLRVRLDGHPDAAAAMAAIGTGRCLQHFSARSNFAPTNGVALYSLFRARPGSGFQRVGKLGWFVFERKRSAYSERGAQLVNDARGQGRILALHVAFELAQQRLDGLAPVGVLYRFARRAAADRRQLLVRPAVVVAAQRLAQRGLHFGHGHQALLIGVRRQRPATEGPSLRWLDQTRP